MKYIPLSLTLLRAVAAGVVLVLVWYAPIPRYFGVCLVVAIVSDYFDGVIARWLGVATEGLRRLDTIVDSLFYSAATYAVWILHPGVLRQYALPLILIVVLEVVRYILDGVKFGKEASCHLYSSKLWGLFLFIAYFALLVDGVAGWIFGVTMGLGVLSEVEGLSVSLILPVWTHDVSTFLKALEIRQAAHRK